MSYLNAEMSEDIQALAIEFVYLSRAVESVQEFIDTPDDQIIGVLPEFEDSLLEIYLRAVKAQNVLKSMDAKATNYIVQ